MAKDDSQLRELKFRIRGMNEINARQGQTIYRLRSELAEVRATHSKIDRGDLRRLERANQEQAEYIAALEAKLALSGTVGEPVAAQS